MPVERIYTEQPTSDERPGRHVAVQWGRLHGEVHVATVHDDPHGADDKTYGVTIGDRADVNRLIRALRKGRDQAFGKDE